MMKMGVMNNLLGAVFGLLKIVAMLSVVLYYVAIIDFKGMILTPKLKQESVFYTPIDKVGNLLIGNLKSYVDANRAAAEENDV